ncbi:MAG TPA: hypothetical protein VK714_14090 [Myxococcota bacterium]|nr:hypothetical protein [Myxococcota bacterium]
MRATLQPATALCSPFEARLWVARERHGGDGLDLASGSDPDLILLKLYAGGPQDAWDIDQLLDVDPSVVTDVEATLGSLPEECTLLWRRIRAQRDPSS